MANRKEHLLIVLAEECAEITKEVSKSIRFGLNNKYDRNSDPNVATNAQKIIDELNDLIAVVEMLSEEGYLDYKLDPAKIKAKKEKVNRYAGYSKLAGYLE
jgi:NTP pyrophosphatase (non-canonical NTP hydrolase)